MPVPTEKLRQSHRLLKAITWVVLGAFINLTLHPLAVAASLPKPPAARPAQETDEERLEQALAKIERASERAHAKSARGEGTTSEDAELKSLRADLDVHDNKVRQNFHAIEQHLKQKKLPKVILDRHAEVVSRYDNEMLALKRELDAIDAEIDPAAKKTKRAKVIALLKSKQKSRAAPTFDPNDLPTQALKPDLKRKPKTTREEFVRAGLFSNPYARLAANEGFVLDRLPGASDPAYRAATTEVTLSPAIIAKAAELNHDPVKIYHWVRNNVEWLPTWGSTQDADVTLGSQRGNALDIASLLIALYRASNIPARYVHGTIEVPTQPFLNWAGGFENINAAMTFASMGGIPITAMLSGGSIAAVQIEHVWVEAALDFYPSGGAINKTADSWVQLDASYKQYAFLPGLDVVGISGINPESLAQSFASSGTINEAEGWVQNLNPAVLQNAQTQAQTALQQYIAGMTNPTVGDVLGGRKIIALNSSKLAGSLPYKTIVAGARYGAIPQNLQHTMSFALGLDPIGEPIGGVTFPWAALNNHKVTLSFKPATAADEATLASFIPDNITDPSQLPGSIPSYLISVIPEIAVDGQVVSQGNAMRLGEDLKFTYAINRIGQGAHSYDYPVPAGAYLSVAVSGGSVSPIALNHLKTKLEQTKATLESGDQALIGALTREDILGDMFHAGTLGYFGEYLALSQVANNPQKARHNLPIAYGTLGYEPNVQYFFGFPRAIKTGGIGVNIRLAYITQSLDGDINKWRNLNLQTGMLASSLEHSIPEQMFSTPTQPAQGVSAVKALQLASQQGQKIYHITQQNVAQVLPNLHLDGLALKEIGDGLAVGKEVIAHTDRITVPGFTGEGYIIFDPVDGSGAYKITGGGNGGFCYFWGTVLFLAITIVFAGASGYYYLAAGALVAYKDFLERVSRIDASDPEKMYSELKEAAALAVIATLGDIALTNLGKIGEIVGFMMMCWLYVFEKVWYNEPLLFSYRQESRPA